jgi:hypothetical protein
MLRKCLYQASRRTSTGESPEAAPRYVERSEETVRSCKIPFLVLIVMLSAAGTAQAQLNGLHLKGDAGLDSGSQAPVERTRELFSIGTTPGLHPARRQYSHA